MELAYLSALLERRQDGHQSKRFKAIKTFFESAVSVVPIESLFHAMANGIPDVVLQCCEIFSGDTLPASSFSSEFLLTSMERALSHIFHVQHYLINPHFRLEMSECPTLDEMTSAMMNQRALMNQRTLMHQRALMDDYMSMSANEPIRKPNTKRVSILIC